MLPAPWLIAVGLVVALLVLLPARRLQLAGFSARTISLYALAVWSMAMLLAFRPIGARFLVPFLIVAYIAPFVGAPEGVRRVIGRGSRPTDPGRPPMKNVTPPDADRPAPAAPPAAPPAGPGGHDDRSDDAPRGRF
jgi:hypothetical protein